MTDDLQAKFNRLKACLLDLQSVAVAFSGGVDSTFLLKSAHDTLGRNAIAVTVTSRLFPEHESQAAAAFCRQENIRQILIPIDELKIEGFAANPPNRCYLCKANFLREIKKTAQEQHVSQVVEGSNLDDLSDYRPGLKAVDELGVISPLRLAGMNKQDIRDLSRQLGLPTWNKPSFACLASRFAYGEPITPQKLSAIGRAEQLLTDLGFEQRRVRLQNQTARIEIQPEDFDKIMKPQIRSKITVEFAKLGFLYTALDLNGYKTGSLNAALARKDL